MWLYQKSTNPIFFHLFNALMQIICDGDKSFLTRYFAQTTLRTLVILLRKHHVYTR